MCWTFFIFVWCSCIQRVLMQNTSWDLVTSPVVFGKPVELRCTVKLVGGIVCCSQLTRIWSKDSTQILTNGVPSLPSKYYEKIDAANKQFSLVINDLSKEDVDVVYTCAYGNISPQKTLTQNDSFEYHPTESECPVKVDSGKLVGTLSVAMVAPYPAVFAQYGDSNITSYLTTNITTVANSTKFYTIKSYLNRKATCGNDVKFTLSVLTGVKTTNICDNVNFCECGTCAGNCFGYSILGTVIGIIILITISQIRCLQCLQTVKEDNAEVNAECGSAEQPGVLQKIKDDCNDYPETVCEEVGRSMTLTFPDDGKATTKVRWYYVKRRQVYLITDGDVITKSPIKDRLSISRDDQSGKKCLRLSNLQESDDGVYICMFGEKDEWYELKVTDEGGDFPKIVLGHTGNFFYFFAPRETDKLTNLVWYHGKHGPVYQINDCDSIKTDLLIKDRVSIKKDHQERKDLLLKDLQQSDEGMYISMFGQRKKEYTLKVADKKETQGGQKGESKTFIFPDECNTITKVRWYYVKHTPEYLITDGDHIITDSPIKGRVSISKDDKTGKNCLRLSDLQESDEGMYICRFGEQMKEYELKVSVHPQNPPCPKLRNKKAAFLAFCVSVVVDIIVAPPIGFKICPCIDGADPYFIVFGVLTCLFTAAIVLYKMQDSKWFNGKAYGMVPHWYY